jgi:CubicO group peptidase (beta-lactamase class C family)
MAILQLVSERRITQDTKLSTIFGPNIRSGHVTIGQLLRQTSGIEDYITSLHGGESADQVLSWTLNRRVGAAPAFKYSNSNYFLLGRVIERVTGEAYWTYISRHIARPMGLSSLRAGSFSANPLVSSSIAYSAGGLDADLADMMRWSSGLLGSDVSAPANKIIRMATGGPYFAGFYIRRMGNDTLLVHDGLIARYRSFQIIDVTHRTGVVVLGTDGADVTEQGIQCFRSLRGG